MRTKKELIKLIQDFIGEDGYVPFEHGYRPHINAYGVAYDHIDCRTGGKHCFEDMDEAQLTNIALDLLGYLNYCHLEA